ncbi:MAG: hypothetical protein ACK4PR_05100, partial [Gammaproteobacteria bacterium]
MYNKLSYDNTKQACDLHLEAYTLFLAKEVLQQIGSELGFKTAWWLHGCELNSRYDIAPMDWLSEQLYQHTPMLDHLPKVLPAESIILAVWLTERWSCMPEQVLQVLTSQQPWPDKLEKVRHWIMIASWLHYSLQVNNVSLNNPICVTALSRLTLHLLKEGVISKIIAALPEQGITQPSSPYYHFRLTLLEVLYDRMGGYASEMIGIWKCWVQRYGSSLAWEEIGKEGLTLPERALQEKRWLTLGLFIRLGCGYRLSTESLLAAKAEYAEVFTAHIEEVLKQQHAGWVLATGLTGFARFPASADSNISVADDSIRPAYDLQAGATAGNLLVNIFVPGTGEVRRDNAEGVRPVAYLPEHGLHVKGSPEWAAMEVAMGTLGEWLCPGLVVPSCALGYKEQTGNHRRMLLVTPHIAGEDVKSLLVRDRDGTLAKLNQLDPVAYSALVIYSLLTTPEDGRWANYMLVKMAEEVPWYRLVAIDNDHNLVAPLEVDKKVGRILHFKSALFCLDAAKRSLHPLVMKRLLEMDTITGLEAWLKQLAEMAIGFDVCFDEKMREELFKQNQFVRMLLPTRSVVRIYQNMQRLQKLLKQKPEMTILAILRALWPVVGLRYEVTFTQADTADRRFEQLEQEDKISKALALLQSTQRSTRTMRELHCSIGNDSNYTSRNKMRHIPKEQLIGTQLQIHINTPIYHYEELHLALMEHEELEEIMQQLNNKRLALDERIKVFNNLLLDKHMKKVIETNPWQMWSRDLQEKVIEQLIIGVHLRSLRLKDTSILQDRELSQIAQSCVSLEEIWLEECPNVEATGIAAIVYHCRSLRSLQVRRLKELREWP